jgi:thiamine-phosphate pyrophosphorylase
MRSRKNLLRRSRLYLILDRPGYSKFSLKKISRLVGGNKIGLLQLRDKSSDKTDVLKFAAKLAKKLAFTKTLFIINDYIDVASAVSADGVHLGQKDISLKRARKILGKDKLIGISCHNLAQALQAQKQGADYIGIGPVYVTATKPGCRAIGLAEAAKLKAKIRIPYFAIGNINQGNIHQVASCGIKRVAVCRAILGAAKPRQAVKQLHHKLIKL